MCVDFGWGCEAGRRASWEAYYLLHKLALACYLSHSACYLLPITYYINCLLHIAWVGPVCRVSVC